MPIGSSLRDDPVVTAVAQAERQASWDELSCASTDIVFPHVTLSTSILSMSRPVAGFEPATRYGLPALVHAALAATLVDGPWPSRRPTTPADTRSRPAPPGDLAE